MKTNPRMADLFRAGMEMMLIMMVAAFSASNAVRDRSVRPTPHTDDRRKGPKTSEPGAGASAVIALDTSVGQIELEGRSLSFDELLQAKVMPENVVLRLKGAQWQRLTELVRSRDLHFVVESDQ